MAESGTYVGSHFFPDVAHGTVYRGYRCKDLRQLTFPDAVFDLVISQDVMEHVPNPERAFAEIARVLKPGGAHVFTIPFHSDKPTVTRVRVEGERVQYLLEKHYHGNPIDSEGSLVITDWGNDIDEHIARASGMKTVIRHLQLGNRGLAGEYVFISRKE